MLARLFFDQTGRFLQAHLDDFGWDDVEKRRGESPRGSLVIAKSGVVVGRGGSEETLGRGLRINTDGIDIPKVLSQLTNWTKAAQKIQPETLINQVLIVP